MKKSLLVLGLAVVGTGMIVKKMRNKKNKEVEEMVEVVEETIENENLDKELAIDNEEEIEILDCENIYVPEENSRLNKALLKITKKIGRKLVKLGDELNNINAEDYDVHICEEMLVSDKYKKECLRKLNFMKLRLLLRLKCLIFVYRMTYRLANVCKKLNK